MFVFEDINKLLPNNGFNLGPKIKNDKSKYASMDVELSVESAIPYEFVEWVAQDVKKRLETLIKSAKENIDYIELERKRDEDDASYHLLLFLGACFLYPTVFLIFSSMSKAFKTVLLPVFCVICISAVVVTGRGFLNAITNFCIKDSSREESSLIVKTKILTYKKEKSFYEEQMLRVNRFIREVENIRHLSEMKGQLSKADFERLQSLRYIQIEKINGYSKSITFFEFFSSLLGKTR